MNKALTLLAVFSMAGIISCQQKEQPVETTITASDVTVEEGQTVQIQATTNSTAPINYIVASTDIATVSASGLVTGVKAGTTSVMLVVDEVENQFTAANTTIIVTVTAAPVVDDKPKPGIYTFTASPLKGAWEAGDQIYIQGGYAPTAQVITLSSSQISDGGKTASAELSGDLFKYLSEPDPLYAVWPAEAVKKEDGLTDKIIKFAVSDILLTQAYLEGTNFKFADISSFISFSVSGGFDKFIIAGKQRPGLRYDSYKNEYSSAKKTPTIPKDDGYPFREGPLAADGNLNTIYFPGGINFKGGFTLYFAKGDDWTASYTYSEDATLKAGKKLELGDISAKLEAYEGGKPHMPEVSDYAEYAVKFNELSGLCVDLSGDFLWALGDGSEIAKISIAGELMDQTDLYTFDAEKENAYTVDSEGLSVNYDTGDLLISGEPNVVCSIPGADLESIMSWTFYANKIGSRTVNDDVRGYNGVKSVMSIDDAKTFGNAGAEGCTYYKDGLVYIGTQTGSYLYLCNLETGEVIWRKGLREMHTVITEIAGLCYDPLTDWLWVIDSEAHKFFVLTGDAEHLLGAYRLKTRSNEESICVDHKHNCVWVGDDYGSTSYIYKYELSGLDDFIIAK